MFRFLIASLLFLLLLCPPLSQAQAATSTGQDILYSNANIYTVDKNFTKATVLATRGKNIVYVGNSPREAKALLSANAQEIDLGGKTVIPGIIEGHMHFVYEGLRLSEMNLFWKSKEEILRLITLETQKRQPGEWITGRGWNQEAWAQKNWPTKEELDAVAPNNPVALTRADEHSLWVNSRALTVAGITKATAAPSGGEILTTPSGEIQGVFIDAALSLITAAIPPTTDEHIFAAILKAQDELFQYGITSLVDAGQDLRNLNIIKSAYEAKKLSIRIYAMLSTFDGQDLAYIKAGNKPARDLFDERLSIRAVKIMSDGSLGSRGAWLLHEYADRPGHTGKGRYNNAELSTLIRRARTHGFQVSIHAIGSAAIRQSLTIIEKTLHRHPLPNHRYRIEHFQIADPKDIPRAIRLGVIPAMQSIHATSDKDMAEARLGSTAIKGAYAWRSVVDSGGIITNGSDAPVESANPFHGIYAAVTRMDAKGSPAGGWHPEQKLTRQEALRSFTSWAAYAEFAEKRKGSLQTGKLADFVVLDRDIMTCPENDIKDTQVLMTILGGSVVYEKK